MSFVCTRLNFKQFYLTIDGTLSGAPLRAKLDLKTIAMKGYFTSLNFHHKKTLAQSAGAVKYTDCFSASEE